MHRSLLPAVSYSYHRTCDHRTCDRPHSKSCDTPHPCVLSCPVSMSSSRLCFEGVGSCALILSYLPLLDTFHFFRCCRAVHTALASSQHDVLIWRSAYQTTWPFIVIPSSVVLPSSAPTWRVLLHHHGQLYAELRQYWADFTRRVRAGTSDSPVSLPTCTAQDISAWQQRQGKLLPVDFAFTLLTCAQTAQTAVSASAALSSPSPSPAPQRVGPLRRHT